MLADDSDINVTAFLLIKVRLKRVYSMGQLEKGLVAWKDSIMAAVTIINTESEIQVSAIADS